MKGVNPAWANLPRRKCDDCGKSYKPKQPLREGTRGFCSDNCRKSYHKHGGAYRKLKGELRKLVQAEIRELAEQVRKLMEPILDDAVTNIVKRELAEYSNVTEFIRGQKPQPVNAVSNRSVPASPSPNPQRRV